MPVEREEVTSLLIAHSNGDLEEEFTLSQARDFLPKRFKAMSRQQISQRLRGDPRIEPTGELARDKFGNKNQRVFRLCSP